MSIKKCYVLLLSIFITLCLPLSARGRDCYIAVEEIQSKSSPSNWGKADADFYYGEKVSVVEKKGSWLKVSGNGKSGWIKDTCVTTRKIKASNKVSLNADEIALAGKGFSNSIESEYANSYDIDYSAVDSIENVNLYNTDALHDFIVDGKLKGAE